MANVLCPLEPEREAFQRLLPDLLKTHRGQFVAIHDGRVVDADVDEGALAGRVIAQGYDPVYIQEVREEPRTYELPSPETVWQEFVICIKNTGYPASLELWKVYRVIPDDWADQHGMIRVIDESGEDYLYPADAFEPVELSQTAQQALATA